MPAATTSVTELQEAAKDAYKQGNKGRVPVTVLTGFLGAVRCVRVRGGVCARVKERVCVYV